MMRKNGRIGFWLLLCQCLALIMLLLILFRTNAADASTSEPAGEEFLPGLLISQNIGNPGDDALLMMRSDGEFQHLADLSGLIGFAYTLPGFQVSSDGSRILYVADDDIWMLDVATDATKNLTATPDMKETFPQWRGTRSDGFLYQAIGADNAITLNFRRFDDTPPSVLPGVKGDYASNPDGKTIAYSTAGYDQSGELQTTLSLYHQDQGTEQIDLAAYGLNSLRYIADLRWSPDGQLGLAGLIENSEGQQEAAIMLLDINAGTAQTIATLPYSKGRGEAPLHHSAPRFDPAGKWLVFYYADGDPADDGLWLMQGDNLTHINSAQFWQGAWTWGHAEPFVSPDGDWIILDTSFGENDRLLIRTQDWQPSVWHGITGVVQGWVKPPQ